MDRLTSQEERITFEHLAHRRGYSPRRCRDKRYKDVSHTLKAKGKDDKPIILRFDLKKQKNKKQNQDWIWIEFKNSKGEQGWIHGDAHFIAFERSLDFIVVNRKELLSLVNAGKVRYDLPRVTLAKKAKYRVYSRKGTGEETTQINFKDLKNLESFQLWEKRDASSD